MIWNQHLLYQIIDVWYHIRKLYLINNEKNDKIKLNHFFYKRRPIYYYPLWSHTVKKENKKCQVINVVKESKQLLS